MEALWYGAVAVMLATYVVLDGFDLGAGALHRFIARTEAERRQVLAAFGPYWDGNEVWLIAGGGTLFFSFPRAYAVGFSGFYLPLMFVLWLLVVRGISIEFRSHHDSPLWRLFWDGALSLASALLAVVFGAALGNVLRGVPIDETGYFTMGLFHHGGVGVLDSYTVLVGAFTLAALLTHGALFLVWKTEGAVAERARAVARGTGALALALLLAATWATARVAPALFENFGARPLAWLASAVALAGMGAIAFGMWRRAELVPFVGSCAALGGLLGATAALRYPVLLASTIDPAQRVVAQRAAAGEHALAVGLGWWPVALLLVVASFSFLFRTFRGKAAAGGGH